MKTKESILYRILRPIITILFKFLFTPKIVNANIPEGKIILAGNHTSTMDSVLLISSTKRSIHFLAKKELWKGLKKILFSNMGLIPVNRKAKDPEALKSAIEYLDDNKLVGIFPEGTTEKEGHMLPFKMGVIKMARETNATIIPFAISGSYHLFSKNLKLQFGKQFKVTSDNYEKEINKLEKIVSNLLKGEL